MNLRCGHVSRPRPLKTFCGIHTPKAESPSCIRGALRTTSPRTHGQDGHHRGLRHSCFHSWTRSESPPDRVGFVRAHFPPLRSAHLPILASLASFAAFRWPDTSLTLCQNGKRLRSPLSEVPQAICQNGKWLRSLPFRRCLKTLNRGHRARDIQYHARNHKRCASSRARWPALSILRIVKEPSKEY